MNEDKPVEKLPIDDLPDDHPFKELGRIHRKMNTLEGRIELAKNGETEAARLLLIDFYNKAIDKKAIPNELNEYFAYCFWRILKGDKPEIALNLNTGENKRPSLTYREKWKKMKLGYRVLLCMGRENLSLEDASAKIAIESNVSQSTAEKAYKTYAACIMPKGWQRECRAETKHSTAKK
ncbi:MAG: hypothetical protein P9E88_18085 [Candidatus Competibacter sp.]|nr:hypothetical protein [Candidatus Competibacter sp.]